MARQSKGATYWNERRVRLVLGRLSPCGGEGAAGFEGNRLAGAVMGLVLPVGGGEGASKLGGSKTGKVNPYH